MNPAYDSWWIWLLYVVSVTLKGHNIKVVYTVANISETATVWCRCSVTAKTKNCFFPPLGVAWLTDGDARLWRLHDENKSGATQRGKLFRETLHSANYIKKSFDLIGKEMVSLQRHLTHHSLQNLATAVVLYIWTSRIHNANLHFFLCDRCAVCHVQSSDVHRS